MQNITREQLDELITESIKNNCPNVSRQYSDAIESLSSQNQINPNNYMEREVIAISIAQENAISVMEDILYQLLSETP